MDNNGWPFPQAVVAVNSLSANNQTTWKANYSENKYEEETEFDSLSYNVNFWCDMPTKSQGKRSRPVFNPESEGENDPVFTVDIDDYENVYTQALGDDLQKALAVCEHHFKTVVVPALRG